MKFLPRSPSDVRVSSDDTVGHGMDAVILLALFLAAGWALDQAFDTTPLFMIVLSLVAAVGLFARFYYAYKRQMDHHERERLAKLTGAAASSPNTVPAVDRAGGMPVPVERRYRPRARRSAITTASDAPSVPSPGDAG